MAARRLPPRRLLPRRDALPGPSRNLLAGVPVDPEKRFGLPYTAGLAYETHPCPRCGELCHLGPTQMIMVKGGDTWFCPACLLTLARHAGVTGLRVKSLEDEGHADVDLPPL